MVAQVAWVLLSHHLPREPSTPRIAVWRRLRDLGVLSIGDGVVALPTDERAVEELEWVAQRVHEAGGEATVWHARTSPREAARLVDRLRAERAAEYAALLAEVGGADRVDGRTVARWRRELRRIDRRDRLGAPGREGARAAVRDAAVRSRAEHDEVRP